jgi:signal peptidase II
VFKTLKKGYFVALLVFVVLLIDQASKFYVKTHFCYNEDVAMFGADWARLHFVENEGMAFGITFDWAYGKLALSLFRILMVAGLIWYIRSLLRAQAPLGFALSVGLITAGALGNILDSAFYGLIFTASEGYHGDCVIARLVPFGEGYGTFLHGKVVDMLYFPIKYVELPEWLGGGNFLFFSPIFNVADAAITTGVLSILLFQRRFFQDGFVEEKTNADPSTTAPVAGEWQEDAAPDSTGDVLPEGNLAEDNDGVAAPAAEPSPDEDQPKA